MSLEFDDMRKGPIIPSIVMPTTAVGFLLPCGSVAWIVTREWRSAIHKTRPFLATDHIISSGGFAR
jgi:hypothetical protein